MSKSSKAEPVFILAGTSQQYTEARRKLGLIPLQAFWLTRATNLVGQHNPKVYRYGDWKSLPRIQESEASLAATEAEIVDL